MKKNPELKKRILQVALNLFNKRGYSRVTTDDLVYELSISKRTLYEYFPSKEVLIERVVKEIQSDIRHRLEIVMNDKKNGFIIKLNSLLSTMASHFSEINPMFFEDIRRYVPKVWEIVLNFRNEQTNKILPALIDEGIKLRIFRTDINKEFLIALYTTAVENILNPISLSKLTISPIDAEQTLIKILLEGILNENVRQKIKVF